MSESANLKNLELEVSNFGPIQDAKIDLRPLTVFAGPSNTGKSYMAILVYALHGFFGGPATVPGFGRMPGLVRTSNWPSIFGSGYLQGGSSGILLENVNDLVDEVTSLIQMEGAFNESPTSSPDAIPKLLHSRLEGISESHEILDRELARCFGVEKTSNLIRHQINSGAKVMVRRQVLENPAKSFDCRVAITREQGDLAISVPGAEYMPLVLAASGNPSRESLLPLIEHLQSSRTANNNERVHLANLLISRLAQDIGSFLVSPLTQKSYYLPADRAGVMHAHRVVVSSLLQLAQYGGIRRGEPLPTLSGVLADFLDQLIQLGDSPFGRVPGDSPGNEALAERLEQGILKGVVKIEELGAGYPTFSYRPDGWEEDLPLMNASSMVSELVPVVLYLRHVVRPGETLIIEEPESHLHPAMQVEFIRQLARAVRSGVRIILTTHSEWVLEELANLVRLSELPESRREGILGADCALSPDEVGAWLFEPNPFPEGAVVKEINLDVESGVFPVGYGIITEGVYNRWVEIDSRIVENRSNG